MFTLIFNTLYINSICLVHQVSGEAVDQTHLLIRPFVAVTRRWYKFQISNGADKL